MSSRFEKIQAGVLGGCVLSPYPAVPTALCTRTGCRSAVGEFSPTSSRNNSQSVNRWMMSPTMGLATFPFRRLQTQTTVTALIRSFPLFQGYIVSSFAFCFLSPSPGVVVILFNRVIGDHTALVQPKDYHHALSLQTLPPYSTELARSPLMSFLVVLSISSSLESIARYSHTL
jgi:hypothetical protein